MEYKDSLSFPKFRLFAFISMAAVAAIVPFGQANPKEWKEMLPKTSVEMVYLAMLMGILANTLNWIGVYLVSRFRAAILSRTDYPYMCVSVLLAITCLAHLVLPVDDPRSSESKLFFLIVLAVSLHNIRTYWLYFQKKRKYRPRENRKRLL